MVIILQTFVLALASSFYDCSNSPISLWTLVVYIENGTLKKKRKRLSINVIEFSELTDVRFFHDGTTDNCVHIILPEQSIYCLIKAMLHIKVKQDLKSILTFSDIAGMKNYLLVTPELLLQMPFRILPFRVAMSSRFSQASSHGSVSRYFEGNDE